MAAKYYLLLSDVSATLYLIQELYNRTKSYHPLHRNIKKLKKKFLIFKLPSVCDGSRISKWAKIIQESPDHLSQNCVSLLQVLM